MGNINGKRTAPNAPVEGLCGELDKLSLANQEGEEKQTVNDESSSSSLLTADESEEGSNDDDDAHSYATAMEESLQTQVNEEEVVAQYRGKLYRFESDTKQWKERGVGKICILQSQIQKHQYRVVMWVEKTGRVACNFRLFPEFTITNDAGNPKTIRWQALDFSDVDIPKWGTFACKFSALDQRNDFQAKLAKYALEYVPSKDLNSDSTCPGCVGCNPETFEFPQQIKNKGKFECIIDSKLESDSCVEIPIIVGREMFINRL